MRRGRYVVECQYMNTYPGTFVLVVGASGSGKGVLMKRARQLHPEIVFPVSCTTRAMRPGEVEGVTYHFVSDEEFAKHIEAGAFLEWAEYGGNRYGTLRSEIIPALEAGKLVLREVEVQGARQIRELIPTDTLRIVYVYAGPWEILERRIRGRAPISDSELEARKRRYEDELSFMKEATEVVQNLDGKFEAADQAFERFLSEYLHRAQ
jgi:guanylate kinase